MAKDDGERISIRLTADLSRRLDKIQPKIAKDQTIAGLLNVNRSDVVRLALIRGLEVLEKQYR